MSEVNVSMPVNHDRVRMRLKVPFLRYALAGIAFLLPSILFVALLPFLINAQPVRAKLLRELGSWTGAEVKLAGAISVKDFFSLSVEARDVEIGGFKGLPQIEGMKAERIVARIAWFNLLLGKFDFDKIKMHGAVFRMRARDPRDVGAFTADLLSARKETPFDAMMLDESLVAIRTGGRKPYRRLGVNNIWAQKSKSGRRLTTSANLVWKGERFTLRTVTALSASPAVRAPLRLAFASDLLTGEFDGQAMLDGSEAEGAFSLSSPDLAKAADWMGIGIDPGTLGQGVSASGMLTVSPEEITLTSAEVAMAGQTAQAALTLKRAAPLPRLEGVLAFDRLDLTGLFARDTRLAGSFAGSAMKSLLETDLRVSAKALAWNGRQAGTTALVVTSTPERISAEIAELDFLGGEVRGHVLVDGAGAGRRAIARLSVEGVEAAEFFGMAEQPDWIGGKADVNMEAEAAWKDADSIDDGLTVRARVNFPEGGQMRLDLPNLARSGVNQGGGWSGVDFANAAFDRLRFDLDFRQGLLSFANVTLAAPGFRMNGHGDIDLSAKSLDWGLTVLPRIAGSEGGAPEDGTEVASGSQLSIKGPWASPTIRNHGASSGLLPNASSRSAVALELSPSGR